MAGTDSSIDLQELLSNFLAISYSLLIQEVVLWPLKTSVAHGFLTVTPVNEPGAAEVLANQNAYYSELRVRMNTDPSEPIFLQPERIDFRLL